MIRNKEFRKYQKAKKEKYLKNYGEYYLIEQKNDIRVFSPEKVMWINDSLKTTKTMDEENTTLKEKLEELN